jgi:acetylornithine deacetylase
VLNGHVDVVPAEGDIWETDPFEPVRRGEGDAETLTARGAADMKSQLAACVFAARDLQASPPDADGRVVVESVVGEEEGGIGAAAAALDDPYPFERDAAIVAEPTELTPVVATEGTVMKRLEIQGRSAHAATKWVGEDVLPHFERIRNSFLDLEAERDERVTNPLYDGYPVKWPVCFGRVEAGSWASTVAASLTAEIRIGVAPGETVEEVEAEFERRLAEVVAEDDWLSAHPPSFERFSIQFNPAAIDPDEAVVDALRAGMTDAGLPDTDPRGATYGADNRWYVEAGVPAVVFGGGSVEQAHFPDETVPWPEIERTRETLAAATRRYLS